MKVLRKGRIELSEENKRWYESDGYKMTGETITIGGDDRAVEYVVFIGGWTRSGTVRDCGDHYTSAGYDCYYYIDKKTNSIAKGHADR